MEVNLCILYVFVIARMGNFGFFCMLSKIRNLTELSMQLTGPYKIDLSFGDVDHFAEAVREWDIDFVQLECGQFRAELSQVGCGDFSLGSAKFNRKLHQFGLPPAGGWTFVVPNHPNIQLQWRGQRLEQNQLMCFPLNGELESVSHRCFDIHTFTISERRVTQKLVELELPCDLLVGREMCNVDSRLILALRLQLGRMLALTAKGVVVGQCALEAELDVLLGYLLSAWASASNQRRAALPSAQSDMLHRVVEYIKAHQYRPIRISELCEHAGVSERTLQYAFKRKFQMTPKQYLQACRLNGVRSAILSRSGVSITDLASEWGFWHMGQFAADYRKLFGVRPNESLRSRA